MKLWGTSERENQKCWGSAEAANGAAGRRAPGADAKSCWAAALACMGCFVTVFCF